MAARRPRITQVTTKSGDDGTTGLVGGARVPKHHPRLCAYGAVDELMAALGTARATLIEDAAAFESPRAAAMLDAHLHYIQNLLFTLGGDLATPLAERHPQMPVTAEEQVAHLDAVAAHFNAPLAPLKDFVLPGVSRTNAALHVARTTCRRAERAVAALAAGEEIGPWPLVFLNRLSDVLFVLARWSDKATGRAEQIWERDLQPPPMGPAA